MCCTSMKDLFVSYHYLAVGEFRPAENHLVSGHPTTVDLRLQDNL